jgi:hypothetical protein
MKPGLDLHLGVDKTAGFVELHGLHAQGYWREPGGDRTAALIIGYVTPPPQRPPFVPEGAKAMTVRIDLPQGDPDSPPHRHSAPGQEMLVYVDDEELEQRRDRRAPRAR